MIKLEQFQTTYDVFIGGADKVYRGHFTLGEDFMVKVYICLYNDTTLHEYSAYYKYDARYIWSKETAHTHSMPIEWFRYLLPSMLRDAPMNDRAMVHSIEEALNDDLQLILEALEGWENGICDPCR